MEKVKFNRFLIFLIPIILLSLLLIILKWNKDIRIEKEMVINQINEFENGKPIFIYYEGSESGNFIHKESWTVESMLKAKDYKEIVNKEDLPYLLPFLSRYDIKNITISPMFDIYFKNSKDKDLFLNENKKIFIEITDSEGLKVDYKINHVYENLVRFNVINDLNFNEKYKIKVIYKDKEEIFNIKTKKSNELNIKQIELFDFKKNKIAYKISVVENLKSLKMKDSVLLNNKKLDLYTKDNSIWLYSDNLTFNTDDITIKINEELLTNNNKKIKANLNLTLTFSIKPFEIKN